VSSPMYCVTEPQHGNSSMTHPGGWSGSSRTVTRVPLIQKQNPEEPLSLSHATARDCAASNTTRAWNLFSKSSRTEIRFNGRQPQTDLDLRSSSRIMRVSTFSHGKKM